MPQPTVKRRQEQAEDEYLDDDEDDYDYNPKVEKITTWLAIIGGIVICIIVIVLAIHVFGSDNEGDGDESSSVIVTQQPSSGEEIVYVKMPDVKGWVVEDARNALYQAGLNSTVEYQISDTIDAGVVINTSVTVNTEVPKGSTVVLYASAGQEEIEVPDLKGYTYVRANSELTDLGFGNLPICMAKNQYSLSDDPKLLGRPEGFELTVREVYVSAGAGFVVALTGDVVTMPGLSKTPAAYGIDVNEDGVITGLF